MASSCFNIWRKYRDQKGNEKMFNEGPAPDGACPSCSGYSQATCIDGQWDGISFVCSNGDLHKSVCNGQGGYRIGDLIKAGSGQCIADSL